jgi:GNAT superfamily N-acetyltransferase
MATEVKIREASPPDTGVVADILNEAARWLEQAGTPMWKANELELESIAADIDERLFFIAEHSGVAAGVIKFELDDPKFWPDMLQHDGAYVHRFAVRRSHAGTGLSTALLRWAVERTRGLRRRYLRLDCEASRPRLRAIYESFGFRYHSDRHVGPYHVSRYEYDVLGDGAAAAGSLALRLRDPRQS